MGTAAFRFCQSSGGVADAEARGDFAGKSATFEVVDGALIIFELFAVVARGGLHQVIQIRCDLVLRHVAGFLRHGDADALGQFFHRFHKTHAGMFHDKADGRAMRAAAEAVIELFGLADGERRGFFSVERTAGDVIGTGLFERQVALDDIHDVEAIEQILNETFWNHSALASPDCRELKIHWLNVGWVEQLDTHRFYICCMGIATLHPSLPC